MASKQQSGHVAELMQELNGLLDNVHSIAAQVSVECQSLLDEETPQACGNGNSFAGQFLSPQFCDRADRFHEECVGSHLVRRYENGAVRVENISSGVIMEERPDGSLIVSLVNGLMLHQAAPQESVLVLDCNGRRPPQVARVSNVHLRGAQAPVTFMHFEDEEGEHYVDIETLRYFRLSRSA
ncbi:MAG: hypothetical protein AMXMBFR33_04110 [Candidatus Xenobia bacterium]